MIFRGHHHATEGDHHRGIETARHGRAQPGNRLGSPARADKATQKSRVSSYINSLEGIFARRLFQEFPGIKGKLCGGHPWILGYFSCTTGQVALDALKRHVDSQGDR
ncbi:hypothetical protein GF325_11670 [Candidatus Bathyarchaeota archaeon]|nr:hypothetical protein [Candidatus Bathyarchaeota archaeon]